MASAFKFWPLIVICMACAEMAQLAAAFVQIERVNLQIGILNIASSVLHLVVLWAAWMTLSAMAVSLQGGESQDRDEGGE